MITTFNEYQKMANRTKNKDLNLKSQVSQGAMGLGGECGEVCDILKKHLYHKHTIAKDNIIKELGDCLWYISSISTSLGITLLEVAKSNYADVLKDNLTLEQYQKIVNASIDSNLSREENLSCNSMKLSWKCGNINMFIGMYCYEQAGLSHELIAHELGSCLLHLVILASILDLTLPEIAEANYQKLLKRYPTGFNYIDSINRKE